jgi:hypothetical protein
MTESTNWKYWYPQVQLRRWLHLSLVLRASAGPLLTSAGKSLVSAGGALGALDGILDCIHIL